MKRTKIKQSILIFLCCILLISFSAKAQDKLYPNEFPLKDVVLLDGNFKHSRDLNIQKLLEYDVDRLLASYRIEAGLQPKAERFSNWDGLDGHIGGHYLSAMAINYASTGNAECKKRMDYMLAELKECQKANGIKYPEWGVGFVGAVPNGEKLWADIKKGDISVVWKYWVPWYNIHKTYSGLRDAWAYGGNDEAKSMFLDFCNWAVELTADISDEKMETMLANEHGGMNEIFADAYYISNEEKYLDAAKRFSHKEILNPMIHHHDNLDNKHANTQVPKAVGFERIGDVSGDVDYKKAGSFFWETVTETRSLAFGGNSRREFFPSAASCIDFLNDVEGPETCNTYNMMKLTENLFRINPLAEYTDYYERAMYNHIFSTQHPEHGGYVYFTPARPRHYRVYSAPNEAMWCCVGSGMENHGKYNQFIYTHTNDSLYLNLFVASELNWSEKGVKIKQETQFPFEEQTTLKITEGSSKFKLIVRYPSWVEEGELKIVVNGKSIHYDSQPSSYIAVDRLWKAGDEVKILLPMHSSIEQMPNVPDYIAFMYGPILLGAKTGSEDLKGLVADNSRWGHIASGEQLPVDKAPIIIEDNRSEIANLLVPIKDKPLHFIAPKMKMVNAKNIVFEPFNQIHDARYEIYWMTLSNDKYRSYIDSLANIEKEKLALQKRTIDFVAPGEQQPEADHSIQNERSNTGNYRDEFFRDATNGGYFSYELATNNETNLSLMVRYWGDEHGERKFDIFIDDEKLITEDIVGRWQQSDFKNVTYTIPKAMVKNKSEITVKFQAHQKNTAGAVYMLRLVKTE